MGLVFQALFIGGITDSMGLTDYEKANEIADHIIHLNDGKVVSYQ